MTKKKDPQSNSFNPAHFPNGTTFTISYLDDNNPKKVFTVKGIVRNGPRSYVLKTDYIRVAGDHQIEESYNIEHVEKILKRGNGPVVIEQFHWGCKPYTLEMQKEVDQMSLPSKKGFYKTGSLHTVLHAECAKLNRPELSIDYEELAGAILKQKWCKQEKVLWCPAFSINKKRLKSFINTNINKFLVKLTEAEKAEEKLYDNLDDEDRFYSELDWSNAPMEPIPEGCDVPISTILFERDPDSFRAGEDYTPTYTRRVRNMSNVFANNVIFPVEPSKHVTEDVHQISHMSQSLD